MSTTAPDTIVLVHGFWVTPRSWEDWIAHYESRGYRVIAPGYPGFEVEVESLNADPSPIEALTVPAIIEHLESVVGALDTPPIIIGHSAGGAFTQILLDHGFGAAGVALNSAPTEGVKVMPLSQIKSTFPVLKNPANRHKAVGFTPSSGTTRSPTRSARRSRAALYERYHVPASGRILWGSVLANFQPGHQDTWVDYQQRRPRAAAVHLRAARTTSCRRVQRSNAKHYKSRHDHRDQGVRRHAHLLPAQEGWQEIADDVLDWAVEHAKAWAARPRDEHRVSDVRITHIGGPTVLIEVERLAAADRPDLRPARAARTASAGEPARRSSPARRSPPRSSAPIDAVLLTHDHHDDNLDDRRPGAPALGRAPCVTTRAGARRLGGAVRGLEPWETTRLEADGTAGGRDHRDAVSSRAAAQPPARGRCDRLRAALGGAGVRARLDLGRHRPLRWRPPGRRAAAGRHRARPPRRRAVPGDRPAPLHDDGARRRRALRPAPARARSSRSTTRAGRTSTRAASALERELESASSDVRGRVRWLPLGAEVAVAA